jgi:IstB-like ATP binding protein
VVFASAHHARFFAAKRRGKPYKTSGFEAFRRVFYPLDREKSPRYEVLVLDDLGYVQQSRDEMEVLFSLLSERYERGSVMLSSNLAFSGWEAIFKDAMMTAAAIDRLVHHCVILELNVPSYRAEQAKKGRQEPGPAE